MSNLPPEVGAKEDLSIIDNSEVVVGLLSKDISAGLQFELGYALKAGKRVIFVPEVDTKLGWFNQGVVNSGWAQVANLDNLTVAIATPPVTTP